MLYANEGGTPDDLLPHLKNPREWAVPYATKAEPYPPRRSSVPSAACLWGGAGWPAIRTAPASVMKTLSICLVVGMLACGRGQDLPVVPGPDAGGGDVGPSGSPDAGAADAGAPDAGQPDAGQTDAGPPDAGAADAGEADAGPDAGPADAGPADAGITLTPAKGNAPSSPDAGVSAETGSVGSTSWTPVAFGTQGPWPVANQSFGLSEGILENPVIGASTDEAQNLWVATPKALYLLQPGQSRFHRFDAHDGLHLQGNSLGYCDTWAPGKECPLFGSAADPGILEIVGGEAGEVFVGYAGYHDWSAPNDGTWTDPYRHTGKLDRVRLTSNGSLEVVRFDLVAGNSAEFWHNRNAERMLYDHFLHPHELYVGTEHGVDKLSPRLWHPRDPNADFNGPANNLMWMSDHLHPQVCYHHACDDTESDLRLGDWRGLTLTASGDLWVAGRWTAGLISYVADNASWFARGGGAYPLAFGDPFQGGATCSGNRPVFCPPAEGDEVSLTAVAVTKDGKVWFASGPDYPGPTTPAYGLAAWDGNAFTYHDPVKEAGLAEAPIKDMLALPDGRLVLASPNTGLVIWDPATGAHQAIRAGGGLPDDHIFRLELDRMVSPPALHVSTWAGAATLRILP